MPSIPVYPPPKQQCRVLNMLPELIHTPSGLAILEIQGTLNVPSYAPSEECRANGTLAADSGHTDIGRLVFPLYSSSQACIDPSWTKKVYLYVGKHQRLTGEVQRLPKALAVVRRRADQPATQCQSTVGMDEELEIVEIIKHKIIFSQRPEPVSNGMI